MVFSLTTIINGMGKINKRLTEAMEIDSELSSLRESSDTEEKRHIKLHARLLALQHELEQDKVVQKRKKKNED